MKIPETSANVGAYYGNEENGQWQPNGVIIDSGVGGGVVGSGDAGIHRPPMYPVHMPRAQVPAGYVMGGYYGGAFPGAPAPAQPDDFADYMWMEHEEEFDKQVMQQLEEEALMEQCIEAMLEDEQRERNNRPVANGHKHCPTTSNGAPSLSLEETVSRSTLNPLAAEFVPTRPRPTPTNTDKDKPESPNEPQEVIKRETETPQAVESTVDTTEEANTEEPVPPQKDPPEVSAADVQPISDKAMDKRPKEAKKDTRPKPEVKKPVKTEVKPKPKVQTIKSETKVQPKKKEVKTVKSEVKVDEKRPEVREEKCEEVQSVVTEVPKATTPPIEDSTGPKPINYAAAAKANKKKAPSPPESEKASPPPQPAPAKPKTDKKKPEKAPVKPEKVNVQRKNSAK